MAECLSLTAIFTSEIVISPNVDVLLYLHIPHSSVVQKVAESCLSALHTNPRLLVFWRRHQPPCVGSGFYRNSLSFLWSYWKWQKGWFFPVLGEEPAYPLGVGGDLAYHLHMFLTGLRKDYLNFMVGAAIFSSLWYFCPMMWSACLGSLLVGKDVRADTWYKCWWCHLLCGHSILVTEWLFCTANEAMSTVN